MQRLFCSPSGRDAKALKLTTDETRQKKQTEGTLIKYVYICFLHLDCMHFLFHRDLSPYVLVRSGFGILNIYPIPGTDLSVFSHWCGFQKHMLTSLLQTKHFWGRLRGWYMSVKIHQSLYVSAALAQWGFQMARSMSQPQKQEQCSYRRCWPVFAHEKWSRLELPCLVPLLILFSSGSQRPLPAVAQTITIPASQTICVSFD